MYTADGILKLVPPAKRDRAEDVFTRIVYTLERWLIGRMVAMITVFLMTTIGLWWLDVPLALILRLLAGLLNFIPFIGPLLALLPAELVALAQGPGTALSVFVLYMVVQAIESYFLTPLIEQQAVRLPPALTISAQLLLGVLLGSWGGILATPLTATLLAVDLIYVEDVLEE